MPKDYKSFCLVAAHLAKNAHRYYSKEDFKQQKMEGDLPDSMGEVDEVDKVVSEPDDLCKEVNQKLRSIRTLKHQNRKEEQQEMVSKL